MNSVNINQQSLSLTTIGLNPNQFLTPTIYQIGHFPNLDKGPFLQKEEQGLTLYCHEVERGNIDSLMADGKLNNIIIKYFGSPYFQLDAKPHTSVKEIINFNPTVINEPLNIKSSISAHKSAIKIAEKALKNVESSIGDNTVSEEDVYHIIQNTIKSHQATPLHMVIHTDHLHPRSHQKNKLFSNNNPVIKIDIGAQVLDTTGVGVSDISRTFFFNKNNIENSAKDRYEKCITLYNYIVNFVNELATSLSIGQSGNDIFNYAESLFNRIIIDPCLAIGIIEFPNELQRNVGHWVDTFVEGTQFYKGTTRTLKENDIVCIELPIGTKNLNISLNYEIQGIITPQGFKRIQ